MFPWRDGRSIIDVLVDSRRWLERKRLIRKGGGCPASAVEALEGQLRGALPADVREFLLTVQPVAMWSDGKDLKLNEAGPEEFFFYGAERSELRWQSLSDWHPQSDWSRASGLAIGQSGYGDAFFWVKGHRVHPQGCIAIDDHERVPRYYVLARSLSEFVAKVVRLKGLEPHALDDFDDDEGDEEDITNMFGTENRELFAAEHEELNPLL